MTAVPAARRSVQPLLVAEIVVDQAYELALEVSGPSHARLWHTFRECSPQRPSVRRQQRRSRSSAVDDGTPGEFLLASFTEIGPEPHALRVDLQPTDVALWVEDAPAT